MTPVFQRALGYISCTILHNNILLTCILIIYTTIQMFCSRGISNIYSSFHLFSFRILSNLPNTYTFTKSLAEHVVKDLGENLPVVIFRPSVGKLV
jgi:hypothetical protein